MSALVWMHVRQYNNKRCVHISGMKYVAEIKYNCILIQRY